MIVIGESSRARERRIVETAIEIPRVVVPGLSVRRERERRIIETVGGGAWRNFANARPPVGAATPLTIFTGGVLSIWLRADLGVTDVGGGVVSQWVSQDTGSNVFAQATGGARPVVSTGGPGSTHTITFDGIDDFLLCLTYSPVITSTTPRFYCGVISRATHVSGRSQFGGNASTRHTMGTGVVANTVRFSNVVGSEILFSTGAFVEFEIASTNNAANDYIKIGGTTITGVAINSAAVTGGYAMGALNTGAGFGTPSICEFISLAYLPSGGEVAAYRAYTNGRWGLS